MLKFFVNKFGQVLINSLLLLLYFIICSQAIYRAYGKFESAFMLGFFMSYIMLCYIATPQKWYKNLIFKFLILFICLTIGYFFVSAQFLLEGGSYHKITFFEWFIAATFLNYYANNLLILIPIVAINHFLQQYVLNNFFENQRHSIWFEWKIADRIDASARQ